jgi:ligand-binding sensor domain-containing protein
MKKGFHGIFIFLLFYSFTVDFLFAQSKIKKVFPRWTSYTNSNYITDLVLDKKILWAAGGGVMKYNLAKGTRVKYLKEHGIASNNVLKIVPHENTLWMVTANGITCYHLRKNTWKSFYKADGLPDDAVTAAAVDTANNRIWFGSWEGYLFSFNTLKKKWNFFKSKISIPDTIISSLAVDPANGSLLVGTWGKGLYSYKPVSKILVKQKFAPQQSIDFISAILVENETLWIGTVNNGLWVKDLRAETLALRKTGNRLDDMITSIKTSPGRNRVFITTAGSGLLIYFKKTGKWKTINTKQGIPTNLLNTSVIDGENIFLGSDGEGIIKLNLKTESIDRYKSTNEIANNKVSVITPDPRNNRLWIGTEGNGAAGLDLLPGKWTILNSSNHVLRSDVVNCIAVDGLNDTLWIGTDDGMVQYEAHPEKYRRYGFEEGLNSIMVYSAGFDHINRLWAAFYIGSPAIFNSRTKRWGPLEEVPGVICYALSMDKKGKSVWMATTRGIINYDIETRKSTDYWTDMEFRSLWFDAEKKEIWAGSWGEGLFRMEVETYQQQKIKRFENLSVLDIKKDEVKNTIWFATDTGAFYLDRERQKFGQLDVSNGLGLNFVLSIGITKDSIWFGTWGGGLSRLRKFAGGDF